MATQSSRRFDSRPSRWTAGTLVILSACTVALLTVHAQDNCATCQPERHDAQLSGNYTVCIQPFVFTPEQMVSAEAGARYWLNYLANQGTQVEMTFMEDWTWGDQCDMTIDAGPLSAKAEAFAPATGHGAWITINENTLWRTDPNYWDEIFGHEFGHIAGFRNVDNRPGCNDFTIMGSGYSVPLIGFLPAAPLCGDKMSLGEKYSSSQVDDDTQDYQPAEGEDMENCWDVYLVRTTYYVWTDGHVTQGPSVSWYLWTECDGELE